MAAQWRKKKGHHAPRWHGIQEKSAVNFAFGDSNGPLAWFEFVVKLGPRQQVIEEVRWL